MILDNPFHVLGLPADAGVRERTGRESQIQAYLRVGKPLAFGDDLYFPGCRRNQGTVDRALSDLHDAKDRIGFGLFWFTGSGGVLDDHALRLLRGGDLQGAISVWARVENRPLDARMASCLNNLGTVCLLAAMSGLPAGQRWTDGSRERDEYVRRGLRAKAQVVGSLAGADLSAYCTTFGDDIAARDPDGIAEQFGEALGQFSEEARKFGLNIPATVLAQVVNDGGPRTAQLAERFVRTSRRKLDEALVVCEDTDPSDAADAGGRLMAVARECLPEVAAALGKSNIGYTSLADRVCEALLNVAVAHWNHYNSQSVESSPAAGLKVARSIRSLVRYAHEVACGITVRDRAKENLATVDEIISETKVALVRLPIKEWLDRAYALLNSRARPQARIDFVRESLQESPSSASSIVNLLQELSRKGATGFGPSFSQGEEMIEYASVVCVALTGNVVSAHNDSPAGSSLERTATRLLHGVFRHFYPLSRPSTMFHLPPGSSTFPVKDEVFGNLSKNLANAVKQGGDPPAPVNKGCLVSVLVLVGMAFVLAIASGDSSGPSTTTATVTLPTAARPLANAERATRLTRPRATSPSGPPRMRPAMQPSSRLAFTMPPVGTNRLLSLPELRWCVRQERIVEGAKQELDGSAQKLDRDRRNIDWNEPGLYASESHVRNYNAEIDRYNRDVQTYRWDRQRYNSRAPGDRSPKPGHFPLPPGHHRRRAPNRPGQPTVVDLSHTASRLPLRSPARGKTEPFGRPDPRATTYR